MRHRNDSSGDITYTFEELRPYKDHMLFVEGEAEISWEVDDGDAYSGCPGGIIYSVNSIVIYNIKKGESPLNLDGSNPLYGLIEDALLNRYEDSILREIEDSRPLGPEFM